jgi:D-alanyl-D-alanine carboxypeptidase/D-alanyl-D-alanine-endopeptidase (penicillin-binding protein 4)
VTRLASITVPVLLGALLLGTAGPVALASPTSDARIAQGIATRVGNPALGTDVTVHVRNLRSDSTIASRSADERQVPASTMKVVTAATALMVYGESRRFATRVVAGADANRIILVGGGDPLLTRGQLAELAQRTAKTLRKSEVTSAVVDVDDYLFPQPSDAPGWAPGDRPTYAAAVRPLALFGEYSNDTVATAWSFFVQSLQEAGVRARVGSRILTPQGADRVAQVRPNTLREAVDVMLRVSENNVAEVLFRQVALGRGYPATWSGGSAAAKEVLRDLGLATWRLALIDGSGLSSDDRLTARFLTELLDIAAGSPALDALIDGLPVAGRSGTLINRFAAPPASCARGEVAAKTGSLTGVSTLAGITRGDDGQWRSFAVLVNRRPAAYPTTSTSLAIDTLAAVVQGCA